MKYQEVHIILFLCVTKFLEQKSFQMNKGTETLMVPGQSGESNKNAFRSFSHLIPVINLANDKADF